MSHIILIALLLAAIAAQLPGCHYYVDATPKIIISSEPFVPPSPQIIRSP